MATYLIYFNQQWVGDHPQEWFLSRVEPSMAVIREMKEAGVYVFAGGLEEDGPVFAADATSGTTTTTTGWTASPTPRARCAPATPWPDPRRPSATGWSSRSARPR